MKYSPILSIAILALAGGCSTTTDLSGQMSGWQGQDVALAIGQWGEPEAREPFGEQTVLIWRDRSWALFPAGSQASVEASAVVCERMLAVAGSSEVTGWRWRGDACLSLHSELRPAQALLAGTAQ